MPGRVFLKKLSERPADWLYLAHSHQPWTSPPVQRQRPRRWCRGVFYFSHSDRQAVPSDLILMCIFLMVRDVELLFVCLFAMFFREMSVSFAHFLIA